MLNRLKISDSGISLMLVASVSFGLMNVSVKMLGAMHVVQVVFFRAVVQLLMSSVLIYRAGISPWGKQPKWLVLRGLFGSLGLVGYFYTLQVMPLGNAIVIHYLSPMLTALLAMLLFQERVQGSQWLFFGLSFAGVIVVNGLSDAITWYGIAGGLDGAVFSAGAYNTIRHLKDSEHPNVIIFYFPLVTFPLSLLHGAIDPSAWRWPVGEEWAWILAMGIFTHYGQYFMTRAYQREEASKVSAVSYAGILWAALFGVFWFGERYQMGQFLGMGLVLLGMFLNVRSAKKTA
ncbi:MAG: DMT family transporter [Bacteroidia bacterium]